MGFAKDFVWGAATAAYQIEGAVHEDGRGLSVWDVFCRREGAVHGGQSGEVACDHYHRYAEDVALMRQIGLNGYRFSISWPRVLPEGVGRINEAGLAFYDKLVDSLLAAGVTPYITLFHWDFPFELYCKGGWLNRDSAAWFAEYARVVTERLSDRVRHWMTLNEPQCFVTLGHSAAVHAPGVKLAFPTEYLRVAHHALIAHGAAVQAIRAATKQPAQIGYAPMGVMRTPATDSPADIAAAKQATFGMPQYGDFWASSWWMDPVYLGCYPEDGLAMYGKDMPAGFENDLATIHQPLDFFGFNLYSASRVRMGEDGKPVEVPMATGYPITRFNWYVTPEALYWAPKFYHERYGLPIYVTENGMSNADWPMRDDRVHDAQRIDFLARYLREYRRAAEDGVPLAGYFQWSLLDNFEWAEGYKERFGLIYVDYPTGTRIPKDSAYWYGETIRANGENLEDAALFGR
ncbi:MAG: Beta-glucosidase A [bacterium ADurb.Bin429]|nr:MAG: Beta-glucosidase A [bacterium ADurb.Bin429]